MKKKYKIVKTKKFKEQEKALPKKVKKELAKALESISKNPTEAPNSMSVFGEPSAKELKQWASDVDAWKIDLILEYLEDKSCLSKKGKKLAHEFWEEFIEENPTPKNKIKKENK